MNNTPPSIAVAIPCYQEEQTIQKVVTDFRRELPQARIIVFDNNCTDRTAEIARSAGAEVVREKRQGKGYVVATIFATVDVDILVLVDGDDTYSAVAVHALIEPLLKGDADSTVAARLSLYEGKAFRRFHIVGNQTICGVVNWIFGCRITDIFSGYRAFTREAMHGIPVTAAGFDVETELTMQALYRGFVLKEIEAPYGERPSGSSSKLKTIPDGVRVLVRLAAMFRTYKPLTFFGGVALVCLFFALAAGALPILDYIQNQYVYHVPLALLAAALVILSFLNGAVGIILSSLNHRLRELERITLVQAKKRPPS